MLDGKIQEFLYGKIKFLIGCHVLNSEALDYLFRMEDDVNFLCCARPRRGQLDHKDSPPLIGSFDAFDPELN